MLIETIATGDALLSKAQIKYITLLRERLHLSQLYELLSNEALHLFYKETINSEFEQGFNNKEQKNL